MSERITKKKRIRIAKQILFSVIDFTRTIIKTGNKDGSNPLRECPISNPLVWVRDDFLEAAVDIICNLRDKHCQRFEDLVSEIKLIIENNIKIDYTPYQAAKVDEIIAKIEQYNVIS